MKRTGVTTSRFVELGVDQRRLAPLLYEVPVRQGATPATARQAHPLATTTVSLM
jgi:hypothetical protein